MGKPEIFENVAGDFVEWQENDFTYAMELHLRDLMNTAMIRGLKAVSFEDKEYQRGQYEAFKYISNTLDGGSDDGE